MRSRTHVLALVALGCAAGCSTPGPAPMDDAGFFRCGSDTDCDDATACTIDTCGVGGTCQYTALSERCPAGETCVPGAGCMVTVATCDDNADCDDSIACTIDSCGVDMMCRNMAINERCTDPAAPTCDPTMGCVAGSGCTGDADCDDRIECTLDSCGADMTCRNMPINARCEAGETCSPTLGCFTPMPCTTAAECQDDNFCNGAEVCMPEFGCAPAEAPRVCNDSEDCTVDSCDATTDMCVFACDPTRGPTCMDMCPPPAAGCNGRFTLTGTNRFGCGACTEVDFGEATFELADGVLSVTSRGYRTMPAVPGGLVLSDEVAPMCPMFDASTNVDGGCIEQYRIYGMFTDDDHFTATVEWNFVDVDGFSCLICSCTGGSGTVMGTRIP
jgi:hypothetical protein